MAEVYTVVVNNETPTEVTGGRVGNFVIYDSSSVFIGGSDIEAEATYYPAEPPDPPEQSAIVISNSVAAYASGQPFRLYVTSPDEIYAMTTSYNTGFTYKEVTLTIFHNR